MNDKYPEEEFALKHKMFDFIGTHPFVSSEQLSRYLNIHQRQCQQGLKDLLASKMIASANFRQPALKTQNFYYATKRNGQKSFPVGISRMALALPPAMTTLYQIRNFLLSMHARNKLSWWDSYWRESFQFNMNGRHESILLHGGGVWDGIPFILEWDNGNIPIAGIERRTKKLARFLGARAFTAFPELSPALIMISVSWTRTVLLMDYFRRAAYANNSATPPIYAASLFDLRKHGWGTPMWLQMGTGIERGYLFQNAGKRFSDVFPGDTEKRKRQICLSPLPTKSENETGARKLVALTQQMSPAEKRILSRVASLPLAMNDVLSTASGLSEATVKEGIQHLETLQLVNRIAVEGEAYTPRYTHLSRTGIEYLAAVAGTSFKAYAEDRNYRLDEFKEPAINFLSRNIEHLKAVYATLMYLSHSAIQAREQGWHEYLAVWDGEIDARRLFYWQGRNIMLYPDSFGIYRVGHLKYPFFVEVERTTNRAINAMEKKLKSYRHFIESGAVDQEFRGLDIYLLLIGKRRGQLERWRGAFNRVMGKQMKRIHLRLSTLPEIEKRGATNAGWLDARKQRSYLFSAPSARPDSARMRKTLDVFELNQRVEAETKAIANANKREDA